MKRLYIEPCTTIETTELHTIVCTSYGVSGNSGSGEPGEDIGYGGVDNEGKKDPAARRFDVWEEDEVDV